MNRTLFKPALFRWQLRQLSAINLVAVAAVSMYVLLRQTPLVAPGEFPVFLAVCLHCGLIVWRLGHVTAPRTGFLHSQGFTRDEIWWQTFFASWASGLLVCGTAWLLIVTRLRCVVQDRWYQNMYFPFYAPEEVIVPWAWLFAYTIVLPLMHYVWVRANQPCRGAASGWMVMTLGLGMLVLTFDRLGVRHWESTSLLLFAALHVPAALLLVMGSWRLHRTMEIRT